MWRNFTIPSQETSEVRNVPNKSWRNLSNAIIRIYKPISKLWKGYEKKNCIKNFKMFIYYLKIDFYGWKNIFLICNNVYLDRSELDLSDTTIRIQNFYFCRKLWWKNWWNYYVAKKRMVSKLSKISNPNLNSTNWKLELRLCQNFT